MYNVFIDGDEVGICKAAPFIGETIIAPPGVGATQTFISVGAFDTRQEAEACDKYINSKFAQAMLSIKKCTQHNPAATWEYVPLQDFTPNSDIDWSRSPAQIDAQLYKKYNLTHKEIAFIEAHYTRRKKK